MQRASNSEALAFGKSFLLGPASKKTPLPAMSVAWLTSTAASRSGPRPILKTSQGPCSSLQLFSQVSSIAYLPAKWNKRSKMPGACFLLETLPLLFWRCVLLLCQMPELCGRQGGCQPIAPIPFAPVLAEQLPRRQPAVGRWLLPALPARQLRGWEQSLSRKRLLPWCLALGVL